MLVGKVAETSKWLRKYLEINGRTKSSVIKAYALERGIKTTWLNKALERTNVKVTGEGFPRNTYWELEER